MKRLLALALLVAAVGCQEKNTITAPSTKTYDQYKIEATVYHDDSTKSVPGARGTFEDLFTKQKKQVRADDLGVIGPLDWEGDPRISGLRIVIESGTVGGILYDQLVIDIVPSCIEDPTDKKIGLCRFNLELVDSGIGK